MDTRSLEVFLHLSQSLHFGRSAEALNLSPSALSRQIKQLEEKLGCTLFERDNRSVRLSNEGQALQAYARETLQQWQSFKHSLHSEELRGRISLYCSVTASYSLLYEILRQFRRAHPKVELTIHTGDPAQAIPRALAGDEDFCIAARPNKLSPQLAFHSMKHSPLLCIGPAEQVFEEPQKLKDWGAAPLILPETGLTRERANAWFAKGEISPNIYAQVSGHEAVVSMVALGLGLGIVPKLVLDNSPLASQVRVLDAQLPLGIYDVGICTQRKRLDKDSLIQGFWQLLQK
ncbi:MAG: HTH-type transcriptional activator IlvY [Cellvibrionaceae bacterium]|nr:HTH-type transcriptional activator IlvY [Cellvibrionaceae bacterium]